MDTINHPLKEVEATQIACRIVEAYGGHINFYRLVKLLYLIEREAWQKLNQPAMGGDYFSLPDGPMISETSDAAKAEYFVKFPFWNGHLKTTPYGQGNEITLANRAGRDEISDALLDIVDDVIKRTKKWKNAELKTYCHDLKEFREPPRGGRFAICAEEILRAVGKSDGEIRKLQAESQLWRKLDEAIG